MESWRVRNESARNGVAHDTRVEQIRKAPINIAICLRMVNSLPNPDIGIHNHTNCH